LRNKFSPHHLLHDDDDDYEEEEDGQEEIERKEQGSSSHAAAAGYSQSCFAKGRKRAGRQARHPGIQDASQAAYFIFPLAVIRYLINRLTA
jgi:hypothetical protein